MMADGLTKEQRKRRAKKEAQKRKKEAEKEVQDDEEDNFESELCWCIEQLELGLKNKKPSKDEAQKAQKMIKTLRSEKTAKVRKRQIMHNTFGNYRKKMVDDMKRDKTTSKEPNFVAIAEDKLKRCVYIKSKVGATTDKQQNDSSRESCQDVRVSNEEKWRFKASDNSFVFSFSDPQS